MKTVDFKLENNWRVEITPENLMESGKHYNASFALFRQNGNEFELQVRGQIKHDGCADIGFAESVMIHFCDRADAQVFDRIYEECREFFE